MMQANAEFWLGRTVCVTGGSGFLGWHIVRQLLALGAEVRTLTLAPPAEHPIRAEARVQKYFGDLRDPQLLKEALRGAAVVIHTAGSVSVSGAALKGLIELHDRGTASVIAAADSGAKIVHTSSIVAIGASKHGTPLDEGHTFNLTELDVDYVRAKRASEETALKAASAGRPVVVVNPGYLVGPDDWLGSVMGKLCIRFWKGRLFVVPRSGFNFVDVRDVALGHLLAAERGEPGRRYILGGENETLKQFLVMLSEVASLRPRGLLTPPHWLLRVAATVAERRARRKGREAYPSIQQTRLNRWYWYVNSARATRELGWSPRSLRESLTDTFLWYQSRDAIPLRSINRWWMRPVKVT